MIRRKWVIYDRRSRRIASLVYSYRRQALHDLNRLNDYCGRKRYAMQLMRVDMETGNVISHYPNIKLDELPNQEGHKVAF